MCSTGRNKWLERVFWMLLMNCQEHQHNTFNLFPFYIKTYYLYRQQVGMIAETGPGDELLKTDFFSLHVGAET